MAIKASATVTLSCYRDTESITRYYKLQSSTASAPSKPTTKPPSGWTDAEPSYTSGSTNTLYFCDLTVFSDGTWAYSTVSKSSSYEAAKEAYNKAVAAKDAADNAQEDIEALTTRVTNAELDIDSANAQIELRATKSEVTTLSNNLANNYYTKTQSDSNLTIKANEITSSVSETYATQTSLATTNNNVSTAQSTANSALSTAQKTAAVDYSGGKMLYTDPTFSNGNNSTNVYNNNYNGTVTVTRSAVSSDNPYKTSTSYELVITNTGTASPGCGGFNFGNMSRANAVFIYRIVAKIPTGRYINWAANSLGTGWAVTWLTPKSGTGAFTEYVVKAVCGSSGNFSSIGYFYIDGAVGTTDSPVTWYVAYATCYDMTNEADITTVANVANAANTTVETLSSSVEQLATSVTTSFTKKTEEITALQNSVNGLTNDISNVDKKVSDVTAWFTQSMDSDGNPVMELGTTANELSMELSNSQLGFKDAGVLVAYINGKKMYITEAEITGQLKFGNYAWIPNGSHMTLKYLG